MLTLKCDHAKLNWLDDNIELDRWCAFLAEFESKTKAEYAWRNENFIFSNESKIGNTTWKEVKQ